MPRRRPNARARDASMSEIDDPGRLHHHLFQRTLIFSRERRGTNHCVRRARAASRLFARTWRQPRSLSAHPSAHPSRLEGAHGDVVPRASRGRVGRRASHARRRWTRATNGTRRGCPCWTRVKSTRVSRHVRTPRRGIRTPRFTPHGASNASNHRCRASPSIHRRHHRNIKPKTKKKLTSPRSTHQSHRHRTGCITTDPAAMILPIDDHMVHRGHGVFDTAHVCDGRCHLLDRHLGKFLLIFVQVLRTGNQYERVFCLLVLQRDSIAPWPPRR